MTLIELTGDDIAAMIRGDAFVRPGIAQPPGGVDEPQTLAYIGKLAENLRTNGFAGGHWMMVAGGEVVGLCGFKARASRDGEVELGYGVAASRRRLGHATAAVAAVIEETQRRNPAVRAIVALTAVTNEPSQRVLADNGFTRTGTSVDPVDGELIIWRRDLPAGR